MLEYNTRWQHTPRGGLSAETVSRNPRIVSGQWSERDLLKPKTGKGASLYCVYKRKAAI